MFCPNALTFKQLSTSCYQETTFYNTVTTNSQLASTWVISVQIPNAQVISVGAKLPQAAIRCPARASTTTSGCSAKHNILKSAKVVERRQCLGSKSLKNDSRPYEKRHAASPQCSWVDVRACFDFQLWTASDAVAGHVTCVPTALWISPLDASKTKNDPKRICSGKAVKKNISWLAIVQLIGLFEIHPQLQIFFVNSVSLFCLLLFYA